MDELSEQKFVEELVKADVRKCFAHFGIEGTEQAIMDNLGPNPTMQEFYLWVYHLLVWGKE